jgi:hypothetical protein
MNLNLTPMQIVGIILVINGALIGSAAQLTDLFGAHTTHIIISVASLGNSVLGGIITMFTSQGNNIKNVLAMPGIEKVSVNANANPTLASIAVDPASSKIEPTPAAKQAVAEIAKGA